ncbi:acetolactate decarboxylase [Salidesulfovibrio onnuriiensis]|uniref:acetolactate decarboxylase n=1 Tax=Salidesulfovibrio onnuriiensis TaxID=2583823 RepID=UPI0011CC65FD|nr:acetolactate decarboxylase [Salidesulfovibrio onnuriiensis]
MTTRRAPFFLSLFIVFLFALPARAGDQVYQYSTIDALLAGLYDGHLTMDKLVAQGGFGLGTLNTLDGELVVLDGVPYHVKAGGKATVAPGTARTPFAVVADFDEDTILKLDSVQNLEAMNKALEEGLPSRNAFYAIRLDGRFSLVKARAIPGQKKPYRPLAELVKRQVIVKFTNVEGTLVGFWSPAFVKGVNVPGFHWHFLTKDRTRGGHVLDCAFKGLVARVDELRQLKLVLPQGKEFDAVDLVPDRGAELDAVEKNPAKKQ